MFMPALAAEIGVSTPVIEAAEDRDDFGRLTMDQMAALEDVLGLELTGEPPIDQESHAADVCAAIAESPNGLTVDELALRLNATPEEVLGAVRAARRRLKPLGLSLSRARGRVRIIPHGIDANNRSWPLTPSMDDLDDDDLELLMDIHGASRQQGFCCTNFSSEPDQQRIGRLIQIGVLTSVRDGVKIAPLVNESLVVFRMENIPWFGFTLRSK